MITCKRETHNYIEIRRINHGSEPDERIMWCTNCGAIKIDSWYDSRRIEHYSEAPKYPTGLDIEL